LPISGVHPEIAGAARARDVRRLQTCRLRSEPKFLLHLTALRPTQTTTLAPITRDVLLVAAADCVGESPPMRAARLSGLTCGRRREDAQRLIRTAEPRDLGRIRLGEHD
jgi:hypothetical protein